MEASLYCRRSKERLEGGLKFNVDGSARGKPGPAGVGGVHRNDQGAVLVLFSKNVGLMESNEAEVVAILEALRVFVSGHFQASLVVWKAILLMPFLGCSILPRRLGGFAFTSMKLSSPCLK